MVGKAWTDFYVAYDASDDPSEIKRARLAVERAAVSDFIADELPELLVTALGDKSRADEIAAKVRALSVT